VSPCGGLTDTFDDLDVFLSDWTYNGASDELTVDGEVTIGLGLGVFSNLAISNASFELADCSLWVRVVQPSDEAQVVTRISTGPGNQTPLYNIGVVDGMLEARIGLNNILAEIPYVPAEMRFMAMRDEGGTVHFEYSSDAVCWTGFASEPNDAMEPFTARLVMIRTGGNGAPTSGTYDDFGTVP